MLDLRYETDLNVAKITNLPLKVKLYLLLLFLKGLSLTHFNKTRFKNFIDWNRLDSEMA